MNVILFKDCRTRICILILETFILLLETFILLLESFILVLESFILVLECFILFLQSLKRIIHPLDDFHLGCILAETVGEVDSDLLPIIIRHLRRHFAIQVTGEDITAGQEQTQWNTVLIVML